MIRTAAPADIAALVELESLLFSTDRISRRSFARLIASPSAIVRVADLGEIVAGYAVTLFRKSSTTARLYSIAARTGAKGAGSALLADVEAVARSRSAARLRLEVRTDNHRAIALYERCGFTRYGEVAAYYGDGAPAALYDKRLTPCEAV